MGPYLMKRLYEAGEDLRASHDEETIRATIADVEQLEGENTAKTAEILRIMGGIWD